MLLGAIGILLASVLLVVSVYKGAQTYYAAPIAAIVVFLFNRMPLLTSFTDVFIPGMARAFSSLFFIIFCGSVLGQLYTVTGAADALASGLMRVFCGKNPTPEKQRFWGLVTIYLVAGGMSMAGCSGFVCVLMAYPIAVSILKQLQISRRCLAVVAFAPTCFALILPSSPQIYNVLPTTIMGVPSTAGLIPGLIGGAIVEIGSFIYVLNLLKREQGKGFVELQNDARFQKERESTPNFFLSLLPLAVVFVCFNALNMPVWVAVSLASILMLVLFHGHIGDGSGQAVTELLGNACRMAAYNIGNVTVVSGFGMAVTASPTFTGMIERAMNSNMQPLVLLALVIALLTGASGSASAAISASLPELSGMLLAQGVSPGAIARVTSCAAATLDTLPTNGVVLTVTDLTGMKQKDTYFPIAVVTVILTTLALVVNIVMLVAFPWMA
ncbi:MAG: GntP family permease [Oscillospiraceae bacterium]|nr:GntP family permease [Oscillospiraceae bacterium]